MPFVAMIVLFLLQIPPFLFEGDPPLPFHQSSQGRSGLEHPALEFPLELRSENLVSNCSVSLLSDSSRSVSSRLASFRIVSALIYFVLSRLVSFRSVLQETRRVSETKGLMHPSSDDPPQTGGARKKTLLLNIAAFSPIKSGTIWSGTSRSSIRPGTSL
jgi:hypothetical protein